MYAYRSMKSLASALQMSHYLVLCDVTHSRASPHKLRLKSLINKASSLPTPTSWSQYALKCAMGLPTPPKVSKFGILNHLGRVQVWVDIQFCITQSGDVRDAQQLFHSPFNLLLYVDLCFIPCLLLFLLHLIVI